MERESFEDEEVAALLNEGYISVKVDREERPDIDHIYMSACQAMTGQGGWPLTVLLTPEKKPFFAGTYFPKRGRWGLPGLIEILTQIREKWELERDQVLEAGEGILEFMGTKPGLRSGASLDRDTLDRAYKQLKDRFDQEYGGFGPAPKFPSPHNLMFLLRYWKRSGEKEALAMVERTLQAMYQGGLFDHVGYGFSRYSTDHKWLVPHFEKMLYDNALLALAYLEAYQVTGEDFYARVAKEIFIYILRDMTSPEGGFYSAEDADSEGVEGKFYLWTPAEVGKILGRDDGEVFCRQYGITAGGNFEGKSIPNLIQNPVETGSLAAGQASGDYRARLDVLREKLFQAREGRVHPFKDDKILTSWNGLMIAALARGGAVLEEPLYTKAAERAAGFICSRLRRRDGRLLARYREGEAAIPAYLDDYAFITWGLLELYGACFEPRFLKDALTFTDQALDLFRDRQNGGFFFYGEDAEELIVRPKEIYDGALPSGNSVMLLNLLRLARLTGNETLQDEAERQVRAFAGDVAEYPQAYSFFMMGLDFFLGPAREIVIAGKAGDALAKRMLKAAQRRFMPETVVIFNPADSTGTDLLKMAPGLGEKRSLDGKATAYICQNYACQAPVTGYQDFIAALD
ncbi:MAG: hypothetical protein BWY80_00288 [Firmicutes bacterium ADurb.Bin456]|nr:MAG: hypothetical protein BWY80_00288 [Firmicutes bacterium ADurb.Bin456]